MHNQELIAPLTFEGYCNRNVFVAWLEQCLLPLLQAGQTLILDNASFHKGVQIQALVAAAGCHLLYLPAYSPELNDIEPYWLPLKHRIQKRAFLFSCFRDAVDSAFT